MRVFLASFLLAVLLVLSSVTTTLAHDRLEDLTNDFRQDRGLNRLRTPSHLHWVAKLRARELYRVGFFHDFSWISRVGGCSWGENLMYRRPAVDGGRAWHVFQAFKRSKTHRRTMLGNWNRLGAHIYLAPDGGMYAVQLFVKNCN